jgi:hypothetical protein
VTVNTLPTGSISANPTTVTWGGAGSTITINVAAGPTPITWSLSSSLGNVFDNSIGSGSGTFTRHYDPANAPGTESELCFITKNGARVAATCQIAL